MSSHRIIITATSVLVLGAVAMAIGQTVDPLADAPLSLKTVAVPEPPNLYDFVEDKSAAIRLGKALFWDMQVGSDGVVSCATCHFHAGADSRSINQVNPGTLMRDVKGVLTPDHTFNIRANTGSNIGANAFLTAEFFPLRTLVNPADRTSDEQRDTNDVVSSQGVFNMRFEGIVPGVAEELMLRPPDVDGFQVDGVNVRRVEPRHTPSVINAVFNHRNFWDGRAQNEFNGVNQWGDRDPDARVFMAAGNDSLVAVKVRLINASLASQALAPIVSSFEMSADGRIAADIGSKLSKAKGKKLASAQPLNGQLVHPQDSVLGALSLSPNLGLNVKDYETLIKKAFRKEWVKSNAVVQVAPDGKVTVLSKVKRELASNEYTLVEYNFPLFFGLALQLYQATLVSDDTPYDRWREGRGTLSPEALLGLEVFLGQDVTRRDGSKPVGARCINCHAGPEFTDASVGSILRSGVTRTRETQELDRGWNNIGVRPTLNDVAVGGKDPFGNELSITRMRRLDRDAPPYIAVDGAFKAPGLRNVELTAPYFHNGGYLTLEDVVQFYSRGGDFSPLRGVDGTEIRPLSVPVMNAQEQAGVVAFLKSLTDERVLYRRAPFDHPQLFIPHGQLEKDGIPVPDPVRPAQALDRMREVPAVGRSGGTPLPKFLQYR
jgi:cytochrome c peroxidase